jgi:hypothetical protein
MQQVSTLRHQLMAITEKPTNELKLTLLKILITTKNEELLLILIITEREREREQLRTRIAELEAITNRTAEQERELRNLKEKLAKLEQQQEGGFKKYLP